MGVGNQPAVSLLGSGGVNVTVRRNDPQPLQRDFRGLGAGGTQVEC